MASKRPSGSGGSSTELSPKRKAQRRRARKRQEERWAAKSGPVEVKFVDPKTLRP